MWISLWNTLLKYWHFMQETTELSRVWTLWVSISIYWNWKREKFVKTTKLPEVEIFKDKQINKRQRLLYLFLKTWSQILTEKNWKLQWISKLKSWDLRKNMIYEALLLLEACLLEVCEQYQWILRNKLFDIPKLINQYSNNWLWCF